MISKGKVEMHISFNVPPYTGEEEKYIKEVLKNHMICGDGQFTKKCNEWMERKFDAKKVMLTTSGTSALDMAVMLCDLRKGEEVILPSYTFSSTANAIILNGGTPVFIDVRPDTMNIDEAGIEAAVSERTKAIIVVHYAGVACEMDTVMDIASRHGLKVIEDAAQAIMSKYKGKYLGTIGDIGCFSFHETKNLSMGEGGAIVINNEEYIDRAEILREKGTDRSRFYRGQVDKYTWVDKGDSFLPSELNAAYLYPQLLKAEDMTAHRIECWYGYYRGLKHLSDEGKIELPVIPEGCVQNGHMFYIKLKGIKERTELISYLNKNDIGSVFHYIPLHSAPAGIKYGRFNGEDIYTTKEAERLLRLPMHCELSTEDVGRVCEAINRFFETER